MLAMQTQNGCWADLEEKDAGHADVDERDTGHADSIMDIRQNFSKNKMDRQRLREGLGIACVRQKCRGGAGACACKQAQVK
eukprot:1159245-Pelagomonas_calceolata.AAC.9